MKKILCLLLPLFVIGCANETCNTCIASRTVRRPVEVIYENTTYTTVYEPKTYKSVTYEKKPYNKCEVCY